MKCFYHPDADAVGLCKHCSRGVCHECAAERAGGLACKGIHDDKVDQLSNLVERNMRVSARSGSVRLIAVIVYWGAALVCGYILTQETIIRMRLLLGVMAAIMLVAAIANTRILLSRRVGNSEKSQSKKMKAGEPS